MDGCGFEVQDLLTFCLEISTFLITSEACSTVDFIFQRWQTAKVYPLPVSTVDFIIFQRWQTTKVYPLPALLLLLLPIKPVA